MTCGYGSWYAGIADSRKHGRDRYWVALPEWDIYRRVWSKLDANIAVREVRQQMRAEQKGA